MVRGGASASPAGREFEIAYVDAESVARCLALIDAWSVPFEECMPVRGFPSYKGQRNHVGRWWTATTGSLVNPFAQGTQRDSTFTKRSDGAGDFGDGASQPVDRGDNHGVAGPGVVEHRGQPRSGCLDRSGEFVGEHPRRINPGGDERSALSIEVLAGGADPCVTDYRCHTHTVTPPTCIEGVRHALRDKK